MVTDNAGEAQGRLLWATSWCSSLDAWIRVQHFGYPTSLNCLIYTNFYWSDFRVSKIIFTISKSITLSPWNGFKVLEVAIHILTPLWECLVSYCCIFKPYIVTGDCHTITSLWILHFIWVNSDCLKQIYRTSRGTSLVHTWHHESPQAWKRETAQRAVSLRDGKSIWRVHEPGAWKGDMKQAVWATKNGINRSLSWRSEFLSFPSRN